LTDSLPSLARSLPSSVQWRRVMHTMNTMAGLLTRSGVGKRIIRGQKIFEHRTNVETAREESK
jgi:hypothetical protein